MPAVVVVASVVLAVPERKMVYKYLCCKILVMIFIIFQLKIVFIFLCCFFGYVFVLDIFNLILFLFIVFAAFHFLHFAMVSKYNSFV